jgi:hypothetical protein
MRSFLACLLFVFSTLNSSCWSADPPVVIQSAEGGEFVTRDGLMMLCVSGDAKTMGTQTGKLLATQTQAMITAVAMTPSFRNFQPAEYFDELKAKIPRAYLDELSAIALAAQVDEQILLRANLSVDVLCTAVVHLPQPGQGNPLRIARNMDFAPAGILGPMTTVQFRRGTGQRATCAITWPGYLGIVSGINDTGVTACLLLNFSGAPVSGGDPLGLRLRAILEQADSCEQAIKLFATVPVSSANYVLLADATTAAIVWHDQQGFHRQDPRAGWLLCTNAAIDEHGVPVDLRGRHVMELTRQTINPDNEWFRRLLTASYMPGINAQAMVLEPATQSLSLATANAFTPAALMPWKHLALAPLLRGGSLNNVQFTQTPSITNPLPHYDKQP